jgi:GDP-4-dehydro-6-deoxy-D-mannose reductase
MRALITGVRGFVGSHLATLLHRAGHDVCGIQRSASIADPGASKHHARVGDVTDEEFLEEVIDDFEPTHVFHLAWAFDVPAAARTADPNVRAAEALLGAVRRFRHASPVVVFASSSAVYGMPKQQPIDEGSPLAPSTAYGESKVAAEREADAAREAGCQVLTVRTFNLTGPGVPVRLFPGSLAAQVVDAERAGAGTIRVGRLDSARDYIDVRDAVAAYYALAAAPRLRHHVFNVCGGVATSGEQLVEEFRAASTVPLTVARDQSRVQAHDVDSQRGDARRLEDAVGWKARISISESVRALLDFQRRRDSSRPGPENPAG